LLEKTLKKEEILRSMTNSKRRPSNLERVSKAKKEKNHPNCQNEVLWKLRGPSWPGHESQRPFYCKQNKLGTKGGRKRGETCVRKSPSTSGDRSLKWPGIVTKTQREGKNAWKLPVKKKQLLVSNSEKRPKPCKLERAFCGEKRGKSGASGKAKGEKRGNKGKRSLGKENDRDGREI